MVGFRFRNLECKFGVFTRFVGQSRIRSQPQRAGMVYHTEEKKKSFALSTNYFMVNLLQMTHLQVIKGCIGRYSLHTILSAGVSSIPNTKVQRVAVLRG